MRTKESEAERSRIYRKEHPERTSAATKLYRQNNPEKVRFIKSVYSFGVTKEMFDKKLEEQDFKCAICSIKFVILFGGLRGNTLVPHIDHDHETNEFRGILCASCNHLLGMAHDKILVLEKAILYLKKYGDSNGRKEAQV
jgi:hypothetical protein